MEGLREPPHLVPVKDPGNETLRQLLNYFSAEQCMLFGASHFFYPRINSPLFAYNSTPDKISFYVTEPLKKLLTKLIDFDLINRGDIRLTLGAVEIEHGKTVHFDNHKHIITPDHIMASSALPPGFPAVEIDGKYYWDGGVFSNAPINVLLTDPVNAKTLCILAHLFDSYGLLPNNLDDVLKRYKDISYSGHFRTYMDVYKTIHNLRYVIAKLHGKIPKEGKSDPDLQSILRTHDTAEPIHFVHFLYQAPGHELSSKDYEFSKLSMHERFEAGYKDGTRALESAPWLEKGNEKLGIAIHEFYPDPEKLASIQKDTLDYLRVLSSLRT